MKRTTLWFLSFVLLGAAMNAAPVEARRGCNNPGIVISEPNDYGIEFRWDGSNLCITYP
jgi:hypothetical protein